MCYFHTVCSLGCRGADDTSMNALRLDCNFLERDGRIAGSSFELKVRTVNVSRGGF